MKQNLKKWHEIVCERAKWHCEVCGRWGDRQTLTGHHFPFTQGAHPELRLDIKNGVCVCNTPSEFNKNAGCHNALHNGTLKIKQKQL